MPTGTPARMPDDDQGLKYVARPNGGAPPCVDNTGRYLPPKQSDSAASYFAKRRQDVTSEPRSDPMLPYSWVN